MTQRDPYYFETLGDDFERFMSDYDVARRVHLIFGELLQRTSLPEHPAVLEVGCGTGRISRHLRGFTNNLTVNDISEKLAADTARQLECRHLAGDCAAWQDAPGAFDLVVSSECIEHTSDPYAALAGMQRCLKPGGWLIVTTPNKLWYPVLWTAEHLNIRKFRGREHWTFPGSTRRWLKARGFDSICFSGCHLCRASRP